MPFRDISSRRESSRGKLSPRRLRASSTRVRACPPNGEDRDTSIVGHMTMFMSRCQAAGRLAENWLREPLHRSCAGTGDPRCYDSADGGTPAPAGTEALSPGGWHVEGAPHHTCRDRSLV